MLIYKCRCIEEMAIDIDSSLFVYMRYSLKNKLCRINQSRSNKFQWGRRQGIVDYSSRSQKNIVGMLSVRYIQRIPKHNLYILLYQVQQDKSQQDMSQDSIHIGRHNFLYHILNIGTKQDQSSIYMLHGTNHNIPNYLSTCGQDRLTHIMNDLFCCPNNKLGIGAILGQNKFYNLMNKNHMLGFMDLGIFLEDILLHILAGIGNIRQYNLYIG